MYNIAVIPGDGIGKEVMDACINVLNSLDIDFNFTYGEAGDECLEKNGEALPNETIELAKNADACLFGAAGETAADVIVRLRQELNLFANLRPVKSYPNKAERRIIDYAFQYAKNNNKSKVTGVHKANVLKVTDGLFKEILYEVAKDYEGEIEVEDFYVDATAMYLITRPESFEVIVTTNLFGDILSDEGAGLVGGLGMIPSGNIGEDGALFEPVHGSAPDIAGQGIANPMAMILSACMMLNYLKEYEAEERLNDAILEVLNEGKTLTPDLGGSSTTTEVAEAIINALN